MTMGIALHTPSPYATCTRQDVSTAFPPRLPAHSPVSFGGYRRCRVATLPPSKHRLQHPGKSHSISGSWPPQSENKFSKSPEFLKPHRVEGMEPDKKLNWTKNSLRFINCPLVMLGTVPTNPFPSKYKSRNKDGLEYSDGIDPDKVLLDR